MTEPIPPPVLRWFKVYAGVMTAIYVLCLIGGPIMIFFAGTVRGDERVLLTIQGTLLAVVGLAFSIACALPFFLPRRPWVWIYDLVIICVGMTSCGCLPFCIPLLIFWIKPEARAWFHRT